VIAWPYTLTRRWVLLNVKCELSHVKRQIWFTQLPTDPIL